jgi:hypothetical protein
LICGLRVRLALGAGVVLLICATGGLLIAKRNGYISDCGCFGTVVASDVKSAIVRNVILLVVLGAGLALPIPWKHTENAR